MFPPGSAEPWNLPTVLDRVTYVGKGGGLTWIFSNVFVSTPMGQFEKAPRNSRSCPQRGTKMFNTSGIGFWNMAARTPLISAAVSLSGCCSMRRDSSSVTVTMTTLQPGYSASRCWSATPSKAQTYINWLISLQLNLPLQHSPGIHSSDSSMDDSNLNQSLINPYNKEFLMIYFNFLVANLKLSMKSRWGCLILQPRWSHGSI